MERLLISNYGKIDNEKKNFEFGEDERIKEMNGGDVLGGGDDGIKCVLDLDELSTLREMNKDPSLILKVFDVLLQTSYNGSNLKIPNVVNLTFWENNVSEGDIISFYKIMSSYEYVRSVVINVNDCSTFNTAMMKMIPQFKIKSLKVFVARSREKVNLISVMKYFQIYLILN